MRVFAQWINRLNRTIWQQANQDDAIVAAIKNAVLSMRHREAAHGQDLAPVQNVQSRGDPAPRREGDPAYSVATAGCGVQINPTDGERVIADDMLFTTNNICA